MIKYLIIIILFIGPVTGYLAIKPTDIQETKNKSDSTKKKDDTSKVSNQIGVQKTTKSTKRDNPVTNLKNDLNPDEDKTSKSDVIYENYLSPKHLVFYTMACLFGIITTLFINRQSQKNKTNQHKKQIESFKEKINNLENRIWRPNQENNLTDHNKGESIRINTVETIIEEVSVPIELSVENNIPIIKNDDAKILYFPNPNLDGNFRSNEGNEVFIEGAAVYKFTLKDEITANVEFCDNLSSITIALNNRNEMILSIATETNAYNPSSTKILIVDNKKAKAQLEGNIWVIKEKAKIKYV